MMRKGEEIKAKVINNDESSNKHQPEEINKENARMDTVIIMEKLNEIQIHLEEIKSSNENRAKVDEDEPSPLKSRLLAIVEVFSISLMSCGVVYLIFYMSSNDKSA